MTSWAHDAMLLMVAQELMNYNCKLFIDHFISFYVKYTFLKVDIWGEMKMKL